MNAYKLLNDYEFKTILDVGAGAGRHADIFLNSGKHVTAIDYSSSDFLNKNSNNNNLEVIALSTCKGGIRLQRCFSKNVWVQSIRITYAIFRTFEEEWVWLVEQKA